LVAELLVFEPDLLFSSQIESAATKRGFNVRVSSNLKALSQLLAEAKPGMVIVNLDRVEDFDFLRSLKGRTETSRFVGYYSHVDAKVAEEAKNAGFEIVLPRRAFVSKLSEILSDA